MFRRQGASWYLAVLLSTVAAAVAAGGCNNPGLAPTAQYLPDNTDLARLAMQRECQPGSNAPAASPDPDCGSPSQILDYLGQELERRGFDYGKRTTTGTVSRESEAITYQIEDLVAHALEDSSAHTLAVEPSDPTNSILLAVFYDTEFGSEDRLRGLWPAAAALEVLDSIERGLNHRTPTIVTMGNLRDYKRIATATTPPPISNTLFPIQSDDDSVVGNELSFQSLSAYSAPLVVGQNLGWIVARYVSRGGPLTMRYPAVVSSTAPSENSWQRVDVPEAHFLLDGALFATYGTFTLHPTADADSVRMAVRETSNLVQELTLGAARDESAEVLAIVQGLCATLLFLLLVGSFPMEKKALMNRLGRVAHKANKEQALWAFRREHAKQRRKNARRRPRRIGLFVNAMSTRLGIGKVCRAPDAKWKEAERRAGSERVRWKLLSQRSGKQEETLEKVNQKRLKRPGWTLLKESLTAPNAEDLLRGGVTFVFAFLFGCLLAVVPDGVWVELLESSPIPAGLRRILEQSLATLPVSPATMAVMVGALLFLIVYYLFGRQGERLRLSRTLAYVIDGTKVVSARCCVGERWNGGVGPSLAPTPVQRQTTSGDGSDGDKQVELNGLIYASLGMLAPCMLMLLIPSDMTSGEFRGAIPILGAAITAVWSMTFWKGQLRIHEVRAVVMERCIARRRSNLFIRMIWWWRRVLSLREGNQARAVEDDDERVTSANVSSTKGTDVEKVHTRVGTVSRILFTSDVTYLLVVMAYVILIGCVVDPAIRAYGGQLGGLGDSDSAVRVGAAGLAIATVAALLCPLIALRMVFADDRSLHSVKDCRWEQGQRRDE